LGCALLAHLPFLSHGPRLGFSFSPLTSLNAPCAEPLSVHNSHSFSSPHTHSFVTLTYSFYFCPLLRAVSAVCTLLRSICRERRFFPVRCLFLTAAHLQSFLFLALRVSSSNSELWIFSHHPCDLVSPSYSLSPLFSVQKYVWGCMWDYVWGSANAFSCELVSPSCSLSHVFAEYKCMCGVICRVLEM
jgi:hypothetical protein